MARIPGINYSGIQRIDGSTLAELGLGIQLMREAPAPGPFAALNLLMRDTMSVSVPIIASGEEVGRLILLADTSGLWTNAMGMMQLLPATAAEQAAKMGLPASPASRLTDDPVWNVTLGSGFFQRLRGAYAGSAPLAVAAYNAGPGNVRRFLTQLGDPRQNGDMIDWIESIPFAETRNYVQRVLENAVVYETMHPAMATTSGPNRLSQWLGKDTPG
jgi:hypothetical protein